MTLITGRFRKDGTESDLDVISRMTTREVSPDPDGSGTTVEESVGFGKQSIFTTPEARYEEFPEETPSYLLTANARIDNRAELRRRLDVTADPVVTDADLILAAYDHWGLDCPKHLVGAFAFALWDRDRERLFCARDHVGLRPFFFADSEQSFTFASEIGPLLECDSVSADLDDVGIGVYLLGLMRLDKRTCYSAISRLPPAHYAIVNDDETKIEQYWSLSGPEITFDSEKAYLEEFRRRFEAAIRARLRIPESKQVGSLLSGGLDSSSIASKANEFTESPLPTFSFTFPNTPESDESEYIEAVLKSAEYKPHFVRDDDHSPFQHTDRMLERLGGPFISNTLYVHWELFRTASQADVPVLLDGFGGDQVISHGRARFPELLLSGHPVKLVNELQKHASRYDQTVRWLLYKRIFQPLEPKSVRSIRRRIGGSSDPLTQRSAVIDSEFADRANLRPLASELSSRMQPTTRADHRRILNDGSHATGLEIAYISGTSFGIEPRFPFFDRRLMEFCFRTPSHLKLNDGWDRWILRNALSETLPSKIRHRSSKGSLAAAFYDSLRCEDSDELESLFRADDFPPQLEQEAVISNWHRFLEGEEAKVLANVWRPALLCRWYQLTDRYD